MRSALGNLNQLRVELARALANETRLLMIDALKERDRSLADLAALVDLPVEAVVRNIFTLERLGLVVPVSVDGEAWVHLDYEKFQQTLGLFAGQPLIGETRKARPRRVRQGFFQKFCNGQGIDIGFGGDLLADNCQGWDVEDGDAQVLGGVPDASFDFVYSSHTLEDLEDPALALGHWWRVLRPGGFLILYVPHRDLYEKKTRLPSRFNADHRHFFLPDQDDPPDTLGLRPLIERVLNDAEIVYVQVCDEGHTITDPEMHSDGEYSIEAVIKKVAVATITSR
jgi:SAM-dependent methyltransferase